MPELRRLQPEHLSEWLQIEQQTFPDPWGEAQLTALLQKPRHRCFGLFRQNRLLAFSVFSTVLDEAELLQIAVTPVEQGRGLAEKLFLLATEQMSQEAIGRVLLEVRASNSTAIRLYRRLGFTEDGRRKGYYPTVEGREDALLMSTALLPASA